MAKKKVKRRINVIGVVFVLLVLYIIGMSIYSILTMPIKNIYIKGTKLLKDNEIIEVAQIKNYPSIFKLQTSSLVKKISSLELVKDVNVKKKLNGKLIIEIEEATPLFYNRSTGKIVLSNHVEVDNESRYVGVPSFINSTTKEILANFIDAFSNVEANIIMMINEIEYSPDIIYDEDADKNVTLDDERFLLRMNDGNIIYINIVNMKKLNGYQKIYANLTNKGVLLLDSYNTDVEGIFSAFENFSEGDSSDGGEN